MKLIEGIDYRKISRGKWKYELLRDVTLQVDLGYINFFHPYFRYEYGVLHLRKGYAYDADTVMRASLFHDSVCQSYDLMLTGYHARKEGDRMFRRICLEDGMNPFRAWCMYRSVRMWSKSTRMKRKYK